jgi:hypothetical protein
MISHSNFRPQFSFHTTLGQNFTNANNSRFSVNEASKYTGICDYTYRY